MRRKLIRIAVPLFLLLLGLALLQLLVALLHHHVLLEIVEICWPKSRRVSS